MKAYGRRLAKFLLFMIVVFFILLFLLPWLTKGVTFEQTFYIIAGNQRMRMILLLLFVYALIYPLINFGKKDRYISGSFEDNRSSVEQAMQELSYVKEVDDGSRLLYRRKSKLSRILMFGEDRIEIDIKSRPLIIRGPKRDLNRLDRVLDQKLLGKKE
jgi:hypothetical protein